MMVRLLIILTIFCGSILSPAQAQENALRIEQEAKLMVPREKTEEVWQYLEEKFMNYPGYTASSSAEIFTDTYWDTAKLDLLDHSNSVRHRQRQNLTNPEDRKSGQELIQIKLNGIDNNELNRGEYKYEVDLENAAISETHPLLAIIKKGSLKDDFINQLQKLNVNATRLRPIIILTDNRQRIYLSQNSEPIMTISLDQVNAKRLWVKAEFTEIETELNETAYTGADEVKRKTMDELNQQVIAEITDSFPEILPDQSPKYNKTFNLLELRLPWLRWLLRFGLI